MIEQIGADMMLFSTDYPHWNFEKLEFAPEGFGPAGLALKWPIHTLLYCMLCEQVCHRQDNRGRRQALQVTGQRLSESSAHSQNRTA